MLTHNVLKVATIMYSRRRRTKIQKVDMSFCGGEMVLSRKISRFKCPVPSCTVQNFDDISDAMNHLRDYCAGNTQDEGYVGRDQDESHVVSDHAMHVFPSCDICVNPKLFFLTKYGLANHNRAEHGNDTKGTSSSRYSLRKRTTSSTNMSQKGPNQQELPKFCTEVRQQHKFPRQNSVSSPHRVLAEEQQHQDHSFCDEVGDEEQSFGEEEDLKIAAPQGLGSPNFEISAKQDAPPLTFLSIAKDDLCAESTKVASLKSSFFVSRVNLHQLSGLSKDSPLLEQVNNHSQDDPNVEQEVINSSSLSLLSSDDDELLLSSSSSSSVSSSNRGVSLLPGDESKMVPGCDYDSWDGSQQSEDNYDPIFADNEEVGEPTSSEVGQEEYFANEEINHSATSYAFEANVNEDEYKDASLNDLFPHLCSISRSTGDKEPLRGSSEILEMVDAIHDYRRHLSCSLDMKRDWLSYLSLLKLLTRPGVPATVYDDLAKVLTREWTLDIDVEQMNATSVAPKRKVPIRRTVMKWVAGIVHGAKNGEYRKLSTPLQENLSLPSGRNVVVTKNNLNYQLALLFADESLMIPDHFIFPNKLDPSELPDFDHCPLGELNTGTFYKRTTESLHKFNDYEKHRNPSNSVMLPPRVVLSFQLFIDGTLVARNSVEPISMCPGIFKRDIRNLSRSWFILGYIEPETNYAGTLNAGLCRGKNKQQVKLEDYHAIIEYILHDFSLLQEKGFLLKVPVSSNSSTQSRPKVAPASFGSGVQKRDSMLIHFFPVLQLVISDCKGANYLAGRYGGHTKVKCLVRDCDVLSSQGDLVNHACRMFLHGEMKKLVEEEMNKKSFHKLGNNGFWNIIVGWNARYREYGLSPPEILHMFWLGLCDYLWQGFTSKVTAKVCEELDKVSTRIVLRLSRQLGKESEYRHSEHSEGNTFLDDDLPFPDVSCFRNGIFQAKHIMYGKEKFSRIFLLYCCFLDSEFVETLSKVTKRASNQDDEPFVWDRDTVKKWFKLLSWSLSLNSWFALDEHDREYFTARPVNTTSNPLGEPVAMLAMRDYMHLYKELVQRQKGEGLRLTKFHSMLHLPHYVLIHGSMRNFDGSRPESIGKTLVKDPGARTQHQVASLTRQAASKLKEARDIDLVATIVKHSNPYVFEAHNLHQCFTDHQELKVLKARAQAVNFDTFDMSNLSEETSQKDDMSLCNDTEQVSEMNFIPSVSKVSCTYVDKGSRFRILIPTNRTKNPTFFWTTKTEYKFIWNDDVIKFLRDTFTTSGQEVVPENVLRLDGFTEIVISRHERTAGTNQQDPEAFAISTGHITTYRAHPNYRSKKNWHSWANVKWIMGVDNNEQEIIEEYPARLIMFFTLDKRVDDSREFRLPHDWSHSDCNKYAVIQSVDSSKELRTHAWPRLNGVLHVNRTMEDKFRVIPIESISGKTPVILADTFYESSRIQYCAQLRHSSLWFDNFYTLSSSARREMATSVQDSDEDD